MAETEKCHVGTAIIMGFPLNKIILEICRTYFLNEIILNKL